MIDPARVLFTWPDRGLAYDCRGCGACCKGLGIGLDAAGGELERLTAAYPEVAAFAKGAAIVTDADAVASPRPDASIFLR